MLINFIMVNPTYQKDLTIKNVGTNQVPRKGESIVIGDSCYIINDVIWNQTVTEASLYLLRRNHPLL